MPRTFKFSFPLPGRKASYDKNGSPVSLGTPNHSHDNSPLTDPGSKAERVLGTMDPAPSSSKTSRKAIRKKPSFMSSSSPLLGERFTKGSPGTDSSTDTSSPRPHFYGSSSTLRSYYDPARSPLSISQQTSASSARDMALRKGHPTISSPLSQNTSDDIPPIDPEDDQPPATHPASAKNPACLDLSDLFPQPHISPGPILSCDEVSKSPTQLSYPSSPQSGSVGRLNWWTRRKAKEPRSKEAKPPSDDPRLDKLNLGMGTLKMNVRKPKAGTQHRFDGAGDQPTPDTEVDAFKAPGQFWNQRLNNLRHDTNDHYKGDVDKRIYSESSARENSIPHDPAGPPKLHQQQTLDGAQSQQSSSRTSPQRVKSAKADLSNQSFLELSSSSEDESEQPRAAESQDYRRHRIRDSIDQNAIGDDVIVTSAERIRPVKPKPVVNTSPRRSKRGSEIIPPVPKIPERPRLQQRISSMRWRESTSVKSLLASTTSVDDCTFTSGDILMASPPPSIKTTATEPQDHKFGHGSKIMTVTAEEGELLEAMRKKRATIRHEAARNFNDNQRPKTAGTDGRQSYFGSDRSSSPPPSLSAFRGHTYRSSNGSDGSFAFPQVPSSSDHPSLTRKAPRQAPSIVSPPPKFSPSASSFNTSEMLPSTPRSNRLSPITPISSAQEDSFGGSEHVYGDTMLGLSKGRAKHERKRTISSGVVMLDAVGEGDKGWELGDDVWDDGREERW
ncbi:MAG: hypothetical protein Q9213_004553 [Squamulea squamosa]